MNKKNTITVLMIVLAVALLVMVFFPSKAAKDTAGEYNPNTPKTPADDSSGANVAPPIPPAKSVVVQQGSRGAYVTWLQAFINFIHYSFGKVPPLVVDGVWGAKTTAAAQSTFGRTSFTETELQAWNSVVKKYMNNQNQPATIVQVVLQNMGVKI